MKNCIICNSILSNSTPTLFCSDEYHSFNINNKNWWWYLIKDFHIEMGSFPNLDLSYLTILDNTKNVKLRTRITNVSIENSFDYANKYIKLISFS
jgi:hypothetical protein